MTEYEEASVGVEIKSYHEALTPADVMDNGKTKEDKTGRETRVEGNMVSFAHAEYKQLWLIIQTEMWGRSGTWEESQS